MPLRISKAAAAKMGLTPKAKQRIDRKARVFDSTGCFCDRTTNGVNVFLPFPPSVNSYWRTYRGHTTLSPDAKAYRAVVAGVLQDAPKLGKSRLRLHVTLYHWQNREWDIGNFDKGLLDAMMHAGLFEDDSQVDEQTFRRGDVRKPGRVMVVIEIL